MTQDPAQQHDVLRSAVDRGTADLDAGEGIDLAPGEVHDYLRARGRLATERAAAKSARSEGLTEL